jgi:hypothetical protein
MPISNARKGWRIVLGKEEEYDWWEFVEKINNVIGSTTNSEDKKLGYFFCKPHNGEITPEKFVSKVIFYLWNDVFKDFEFSDPIFNDEDGEKLYFDKFYTKSGLDSVVVIKKISVFLNNLGLSSFSVPAGDNDETLADELTKMREKMTSDVVGKDKEICTRWYKYRYSGNSGCSCVEGLFAAPSRN